jgi:SAM-dependent methyltransferase
MNDKHLELCSSAEWADAVQRWTIPWVIEGIGLGDDVLELGPGPGRTTEVLVEMVPRLTAVEVDADLAGALSARMTRDNLMVVHGDATDLQFPESTFSAALSFTMLHHVPSTAAQDKLFSEVARVLRPGGVFAGTDSLDSEEFRELHAGDICVPVEPTTLADRLAAAGFDHVVVDTNDYGVRFRAWPSLPGRAGSDRARPRRRTASATRASPTM